MRFIFLKVDLEVLLTLIVGTSLFFVLGSFIVFFIISYKRRYRQHNFEKKALQSKFQETLLQTQLEIQEQTLKTISQEIHDNIGQALTLAKLNLNTMLPVQDEVLRQKIINSKELVSKAIGDLRDLSHSLDTDYVKEMGLQRAIEYELEMIQKTGAISVEMEVTGSMIRLEKQKELILFRIVQETLNNIIKHAEAEKITVSLNYLPEQLNLQIVDNGKGVDLSPLSDNTESGFGLGIRNMHSRAKLIAAEFSINSTLGSGTIVRIILPLELNHHEN